MTAPPSADIPREDPHRVVPLTYAGTALSEARVALVMLHGRGASPESIMSLAPALSMPGVGFVAPGAAGGTWYPFGFMSPIHMNEPGISSGMRAISRAIDAILEAGIAHERIILLGFSQGACLATEYVARNARRYGGLAALSGGLIGPGETPRNYAGSLEGTPCFLGCSDVDGHIPAVRVEQSGNVLRELGGDVTLRLYEGMGHLVNTDEIAEVRHITMNALRQ